MRIIFFRETDPNDFSREEADRSMFLRKIGDLIDFEDSNAIDRNPETLTSNCAFQ